MSELEGSCNRCGACCYNPRIYVAVTKDIARWLNGFGVRIVTVDGRLAAEINIGTQCKHLSVGNGKAECMIYDSRPNVCRDYPLPDTELKPSCGYRKKK